MQAPMKAPSLLQHLTQAVARQTPDAIALRHAGQDLGYAELVAMQSAFAQGLLAHGLQRGERVAIFLSKRFEAVAAMLGTAEAGGVFVPVNPLLKPDQVAHILSDGGVRVLVTSPDRWRLLAAAAEQCPSLQHVVLVGAGEVKAQRCHLLPWPQWLQTPSHPHAVHGVIDADMAAILYTSGSTGKPKGVVVSHRNMVSGAASVASYLNNGPQDRLLAVLPLSFDAGLSQVTTALTVGACAVLLDYTLPSEVLQVLQRERITGLTAVPPLWIQLAELKWPDGAGQHLRYFANTGGKMPRDVLSRLRALLPQASPYLMYGLTEAFRSTYLPPQEVDARPDSIGRAIPNQEVLVLRPDGTECDADEPGELVHRGSTVALGYWNDPEKTAERFKPLPRPGSGLTCPELAVFSGDTVRRDAHGYLYFIGRQDEMIKTSGYRISPVELEEVIYSDARIAEVAAFGVTHPRLGQAIVTVVLPRKGEVLEPEHVQQLCRKQLPAYMVPSHVHIAADSLPRNANGKIDRKALSQHFAGLFQPSNQQAQA
ncbi:MAG: acyl-CoA ligase (AMP-forming), exosortase A system-associated [Pseudomonadota bacterium]|nr:acyl-CoA ligase (AMP-forming), exosortase A system-associated [Pseudomonadota bacterium]